MSTSNNAASWLSDNKPVPYLSDASRAMRSRVDQMSGGVSILSSPNSPDRLFPDSKLHDSILCRQMNQRLALKNEGES